MILGVDIGNTSITVALIRQKSIVPVCQFGKQTSWPQVEKQLKAHTKGLFKKGVQKAYVCSVVPNLTRKVAGILKSGHKMDVKIIGQDLVVPLVNKYHQPNHVGQDRLLGAFAAKELYGQPLIIIDFGTATTFDVVSAKGHYEGGMIIPGISISAEALFQKTALLPRIDRITIPKRLIGKTTKESMLSGIFYGYGVMSSGLIDVISRSMKKRPKVIVTGGFLPLIHKFIKAKISGRDEHLVFKGMRMLDNE